LAKRLSVKMPSSASTRPKRRMLVYATDTPEGNAVSTHLWNWGGHEDDEDDEDEEEVEAAEEEEEDDEDEVVFFVLRFRVVTAASAGFADDGDPPLLLLSLSTLKSMYECDVRRRPAAS
jgi:hypothetical protein